MMGAGEKQSGGTILPSNKKHVQLERTSSLQVTNSIIKNNPKYKTTTSLLLNKWIGNGKQDNITIDNDIEDGWNQEDRCMEYGTPPPVEEPQCYSMCFSETSLIDDGNCSIIICREVVKNLIIEHLRSVGGRIQLFEDIENYRINCDNIIKILESCKYGEKNALFLYASFLARFDLFNGFIESGVDINHFESEQGLTSLHLCSFSNCLEGVDYLIKNGANINLGKIYTPFQYAAFGNSYDVAKYYLNGGIIFNNCNIIDNSVLHSAAKSNAIDVLKLIAYGNNDINLIDSTGLAPIHYVTDRDHPGCLDELLKAGCYVDIINKKGDTPLHLAAEAGCAENIEILIDHGADPTIKNHRAQTALHLAARAHSFESVEVLLRKGGSNVNAEDNDGRTPLHLSLGRSTLAFDVSQLLVEREANVNKSDKYGYTPLHVAALNELSQCVDILIKKGADLSAKTKGGTTALSIILRKTPTSLNVFKQRLDNSIALRQHGSATGEVELRLDFHPLLQHGQQGEIGYLETFIGEGYKEILEHPLCQSFLHLKWQKIRKYYVGRLLFYLLYVLVLTGWVMTALAHNCYNESHNIIDNDGHRRCNNTTSLNSLLLNNPIIMDIEWYILIILTSLEALRKIAGISTYCTARQFFTQVDNLVEWCVVLSVFATSFIYNHGTYRWQSHVGAYAVLCGWGNLMLMIGQLPMFGAYVAMFTSIQAQVLKLLLAYACLLVGFTASFCVMFPHSKSFSSPHTGLIKVLVMMTGEVEFEDLFFPDNDDANYDKDIIGNNGASWFFLQVSAQLCFLLFLLFVTIVLMNLLVGIAVHDIKGLQKTAGLAKLVRQTKLICEVETALFLGLLPRRLIKMLKWSALVLPSSLRVVLTVRPLNPREKRLPPDVLAAAHKIARDRRSISAATGGGGGGGGGGGTICSKRSCSTGYTYLRNDHPYSSSIHRNVPIEDDDDDDVGGGTCSGNGNANSNSNIDQIKDEILELRKICSDNQKLIQDLVVALAMSDGKYNLENVDNQNL